MLARGERSPGDNVSSSSTLQIAVNLKVSSRIQSLPERSRWRCQVGCRASEQVVRALWHETRQLAAGEGPGVRIGPLAEARTVARPHLDCRSVPIS